MMVKEEVLTSTLTSFNTSAPNKRSVGYSSQLFVRPEILESGVATSKDFDKLGEGFKKIFSR